LPISTNIRVLGCWQRLVPDIPHRILATFFIKLMMFFSMNSTSEFKTSLKKEGKSYACFVWIVFIYILFIFSLLYFYFCLKFFTYFLF
jgi:hypothetical protein